MRFTVRRARRPDSGRPRFRAECLRKASELDPTNAQYFGLLATVYKAEGLPEDSASMLEKAKSLDPSYC